MADADIFAVSALAAGNLDGAISRRVYWCTARCGEIDTTVHLVIAQDRVPASTEAGRNSGAIDRRQYQRFADAVAFRVVIVDVTIIGAMAVEPNPFVAEHHFRDQDVALRDCGAGFVVQSFEHRKTVAWPNFSLEVDIEAEDPDQPCQHAWR